MTSIKVCSAALDEAPSGDIILRGVLDPSSLSHLLTDAYQREILPISSLGSLIKAFEEGASVPDIVLGMRGHRVREQGGCFFLQDNVYIVDGLQRVSAGQLVQQKGGVPRLGATIHFGTNEPWERLTFKILNADRNKVSPNILLRNMQREVPVMDMLIKLTADPAFVLEKRVTWNQRMARQELITAMTFAKVIAYQHCHLGPTRRGRYDELAAGLDKVMTDIGRNVMRDNVKAFFDMIDQCWGVKRIAFKEGAVYMRGGFLMALAEVMSGHLDFWRDNRFFVEASLMRKLAQFPVHDPQVGNLASSSGKSRSMLAMLIIDHINSGKRSRRLRPRKSFAFDLSGDESLEESA